MEEDSSYRYCFCVCATIRSTTMISVLLQEDDDDDIMYRDSIRSILYVKKYAGTVEIISDIS